MTDGDSELLPHSELDGVATPVVGSGVALDVVQSVTDGDNESLFVALPDKLPLPEGVIDNDELPDDDPDGDATRVVASGLLVDVTQRVALTLGDTLPHTLGDADELTEPLALALTASVADDV